MKLDFVSAKKSLTTSNSKLEVVFINGCCYGRDSKPNKGDYLKLCGQAFWEYISGDANLYLEIIEPLGHLSKTKNDEYSDSEARIINNFTREFLENYCLPNGGIDWDRLVMLNSSMKHESLL